MHILVTARKEEKELQSLKLVLLPSSLRVRGELYSHVTFCLCMDYL
jgi:hypothetical protein